MGWSAVPSPKKIPKPTPAEYVWAATLLVCADPASRRLNPSVVSAITDAAGAAGAGGEPGSESTAAVTATGIDRTPCRLGAAFGSRAGAMARDAAGPVELRCGADCFWPCDPDEPESRPAECEDEPPELPPSAHADAAVPNAAPTPRATAKAPTRPTKIPAATSSSPVDRYPGKSLPSTYLPPLWAQGVQPGTGLES